MLKIFFETHALRRGRDDGKTRRVMFPLFSRVRTKGSHSRGGKTIWANCTHASGRGSLACEDKDSLARYKSAAYEFKL